MPEQIKDKPKKENLNAGHRKRLKAKFMSGGLEGFQDHEVLELLLFYTQPYKDMNKFAHTLINEFGSLSNVFEATPEELCTKSGVQEHTAILLSMVPQLARRYFLGKWNNRRLLNTSKLAGEYAIDLFAGETTEKVYLICLSSNYSLINSSLISEGTVDETAIYAREIVEAAIQFKAVNVVISHNHPGGTCKPSLADMEATKKIIALLAYLNIDVLDHIVVAGNQYYSFSANKRINSAY